VTPVSTLSVKFSLIFLNDQIMNNFILVEYEQNSYEVLLSKAYPLA